MRTVTKSQTEATRERLGGCGFPSCDKFAECANCVQCAEHHALTEEKKQCGFALPVPVKFEEPDGRSEVQMVVVPDNSPALLAARPSLNASTSRKTNA